MNIIKIPTEANEFLLFTVYAKLVSYEGLDVVESRSGAKGKPRYQKKTMQGLERLYICQRFPQYSTMKHFGIFMIT